MMGTNTSPEDRVWSLTEKEIEVLFWVCKGLKNQEIAEKVKSARRDPPQESTIKTHLGSVYQKLAIPSEDTGDDKRTFLISEYTKVVNIIVPDENALKTFASRKKMREAENLRRQMETRDSPGDVEEQFEKLKEKQNSDQTSIDERPPTPRINPTFLWIALGVIGVVIIAVVLVIAFGGVEPEQPEISISTTPEQLVANSTLASLTSVPDANLEPTNDTVLIVTGTSTPTFTSTPTSTITITPTSTQTPSPSLTPTPPYLFETSFDKGLPAGMQIVLGSIDDVDFVGEKLLAHNLILFAIGEDDWKNYQIEYEAQKKPYCWGLQENGIAAHAIDQDNMIMFSWNYCETGWFKIVNGDWITITSGRDKSASPDHMVNFRLIVKDGSFEIYIDNKKNSSYYNDDYLQGKAYILVSDSSVIDNIKVSKLP